MKFITALFASASAGVAEPASKDVAAASANAVAGVQAVAETTNMVKAMESNVARKLGEEAVEAEKGSKSASEEEEVNQCDECCGL